MKKLLFIVALLALAIAHRNEYIQKVPRLLQDSTKYAKIIEEGLPQAFTWGDVNGTSYLTKNYNQHVPQYCGSCWCWAATSALSDRLKIARHAKGPDYFLSVQYVLNNNNGSAGSCYGGDPLAVYKWVKGKPWPYDTCQPYIACTSDSKDGFCAHVKNLVTPDDPKNTCKTCKTFGVECSVIDKYPNVTVGAYGSVHGAENMKAEIFKNGPIAGAVNAMEILNYQGGVLDLPDADKGVDHAISIVGWGYDETTKKQHWIVRNSWGEYWGEMGYFRVVLGENQLGLESDSSWATMAHYSINNFPCGEDGTGCGKKEESNPFLQ